MSILWSVQYMDSWFLMFEFVSEKTILLFCSLYRFPSWYINKCSVYCEIEADHSRAWFTTAIKSHYIEVAQGDIFMEQNMRFGLILGQLAILKKIFGAN